MLLDFPIELLYEVISHLPNAVDRACLRHTSSFFLQLKQLDHQFLHNGVGFKSRLPHLPPLTQYKFTFRPGQVLQAHVLEKHYRLEYIKRLLQSESIAAHTCDSDSDSDTTNLSPANSTRVQIEKISITNTVTGEDTISDITKEGTIEKRVEKRLIHEWAIILKNNFLANKLGYKCFIKAIKHEKYRKLFKKEVKWFKKMKRYNDQKGCGVCLTCTSVDGLVFWEVSIPLPYY